MTYGRVTQGALCDGLEESRFADVGKTDNTTLEVVARAAEEDLLLDDLLLGRHSALAVGAAGME